MKHILLSLLLCIGSAAMAADPVIVIQDNGTVTLNGVSLNNASDALLNKQLTSAQFMAALRAKIAAVNADAAKAQADVAALQAQMKTRLESDLSELQAALKNASNATERAVLSAQIAMAQGYRDAAFKSPDQLKAESLAAEIAAKQAELLKLQQQSPGN